MVLTKDELKYLVLGLWTRFGRCGAVEVLDDKGVVILLGMVADWVGFWVWAMGSLKRAGELFWTVGDGVELVEGVILVQVELGRGVVVVDLEVGKKGIGGGGSNTIGDKLVC